MTDVSQLLSRIEHGDPGAADELIPLVYGELRKLAAARLSKERSGQTLQATELVHEAYLRLLEVDSAGHWDNRGHFFAAAAESMRRILVESARRRERIKHGGQVEHVEFNEEQFAVMIPPDELLAIDDALEQLEEADQQASQVTKLRYFAGMTVEEAAESLGIPVRTAYRNWAYARAWIYRHVSDAERFSLDPPR